MREDVRVWNFHKSLLVGPSLWNTNIYYLHHSKWFKFGLIVLASVISIAFLFLLFGLEELPYDLVCVLWVYLHWNDFMGISELKWIFLHCRSDFGCRYVPCSMTSAEQRVCEYQHTLKDRRPACMNSGQAAWPCCSQLYWKGPTSVK